MALTEKVLMKGNEALAEAAIRAGCRHFFGYPITPQTEVAAYMAKQMPKIGGTYLQAESEVAAINMVYGAASAGVRAMTSSSSPGISLKSEGISYMAGADLPCLIINVQRGSPGLGGIQPSQADYWQATRAPGHGDLHVLVFAPSSIQEMVDMVFDAFDLADCYRVPAMILADGMLGQMMEPVVFPERTVKQYDKGSWATDELESRILERFERYEQIKQKHTRSEEYLVDDADYIVVAYGATSRIVRSAVNTARARGIKVGMIRPMTLWPFPAEPIAKAAGHAKAFLSVEMSMGQMVDDVRLAVNGKAPVGFFGRTGGIIPTPAEVLSEIEKMAGGDK